VTALDELAELPTLAPKRPGGKGKGKGKGGNGKTAKGSKTLKGGKGEEDEDLPNKSGKSVKVTKSSKSAKSSKCRVVKGEPVEFTSFFRSLYSIIKDSSLELEETAGALTVAYNRIAPDTARMENSFLFDQDSGRRLSWDEVRELQILNFNAILEAIGT
jgi:hypothetical protein